MDGKPVVIDIDVASIRAGFAGEETPRWSATTLDRMPGGSSSRKEAVNWDAYEHLVAQAFSKMDVLPDERPLFTVWRPLMLKADLEKITQIAFETFNVPGFFAQSRAAAVLTLQGASTGVVVHVGAGEMEAAAVKHNEVVLHAVLRENYAGGQQLATLTYNVIKKTDDEVRSALLGNIVLAGEIDEKIAASLKEGIKALAPPNTVINLSTPANSRNASWLGGSIEALIRSDQNGFISRAEYREVDLPILRRERPI
ncbi:hypothetical protein IM816_07325 [Luteibacter flocculans]|uniref:Uncharacterized protein n=1 Tax=Luteibacter flocculans TaxID=2780091 RepID=A0ABY4T4R7_9GAMM|nr:hypothetical protein [Luteibacter flocculans]URL59891.1 hypothetical protein IM816_07325 [Luteibacter flocculans]